MGYLLNTPCVIYFLLTSTTCTKKSTSDIYLRGRITFLFLAYLFFSFEDAAGHSTCDDRYINLVYSLGCFVIRSKIFIENLPTVLCTLENATGYGALKGSVFEG